MIDNTNRKARRRVLIVKNNLVLGAAIENLLLATEANLQLIGSTASSEAELVNEIKQSQAEVVILEMITYGADPVNLLAPSKNISKLQVIALDADDNLIHVYNKQQVSVSRAADLVSIIQGSERLD